MFDNVFVLSRTPKLVGLPRIRFDISKYDNFFTDPDSRDLILAKNFLLPEHFHQAKVRLVCSNNNGTVFGGRTVGVWIHTKPEGGQMWSYTKEGQWVQHGALPKAVEVLSNLSHAFNLPIREKPAPSGEFTQYACASPIAASSEVSPIARLRESDFDELVINFNTRNREQIVPANYKNNFGPLHRKNQKYVIEVFMYPNGDVERFMLLDTVEVQNMTLKKMSEVFVTGDYQDPLCTLVELAPCIEYRVDLSKDELRKVFKFFNDISGKNSRVGLASRNKDETETIMGSEGGSKLDYRYKKEFFTLEEKADYEVIDSINIDT
jgi:hypothetical protein